MKGYGYQTRQGVRDLTWLNFVSLCEKIAEQLSQKDITAIVGIVRAGLLPAAAIAGMLRVELFPIRLTRRQRDCVATGDPEWKVDFRSSGLAGEVAAVIDEIADRGKTMQMAAERARGVKRIVTAVCAAHSWAEPRSDIVGLQSDAPMMFPWDECVLQNGVWQLYLELAEAAALQQCKC